MNLSSMTYPARNRRARFQLLKCLMFWLGVLLVHTWPAIAQDNHTVTIVATDYEFRGPDLITSGHTTIEMVNQGKELHHIQLVKLQEGKTLADFNSELKANPSKLPGWINFVGGPNAVVPGEKAVATVFLDNGNYLLLCLIPNSKGLPHLMLGMQKPISVRGVAAPEAKEPAATGAITLLDFTFGISRPIPAGTQTIRVVNQGNIPHEIVVVQLAPGTSITDFAKFAEKPSGPPPGKPIGGMVGLDHGGHGSFTAEFKPGRYGLICFFPDPATGAPHFVRGMLSEFTVE